MRTSKFLFFNHPNFGNTAYHYAKYRRGFPKIFFNYLQDSGVIKSGKVVVDLGTGTGAIARQLAMLNCKVIGVDPTSELLEEARKQDKLAGVTVKYISATAEKTTLPSETCDIVIVGQAWHWFDQAAAVKEILRILKLGGKFIIAHYEWITEQDSVSQVTEKLMKKYNTWKKVSQETGIYNQWTDFLIKQGFSTDIKKLVEMEQYTHKEWLGRVMSSPVISGKLAADE